MSDATLYQDIRVIIDEARHHVYAGISAIQIEQNWKIGRRIVDEEQGGLTWSHYQLLMRLEDTTARDWYINEASNENWSVRTLDRNISTQYYERLLLQLVLLKQQRLLAHLGNHGLGVRGRTATDASFGIPGYTVIQNR